MTCSSIDGISSGPPTQEGWVPGTGGAALARGRPGLADIALSEAVADLSEKHASKGLVAAFTVVSAQRRSVLFKHFKMTSSFHFHTLSMPDSA